MTETLQETKTAQGTGMPALPPMPRGVFNPFLPGFDENPYDHYQEMRDILPVQRHPMGIWFVSRHAEVSTILRDARLSVSDLNLGAGPMRDQYEALIADATSLTGTMMDTDPPDHTRLRSLVGKVFTPRSVAALEPMVTQHVDEALDRIADAGSVNLIDALAFPLPFAEISAMLGMPDTDHKRLLELTGTLVVALEPVADPQVMNAIVEAQVELDGMIREAIAWKRNNPADDLLTALVQAEQRGDLLSDDELVAQILLLYVAGHHTTVNLIGNGVTALLRHPDQLTLLRSNPDLIGNAVEEFLRYDSPIHQTRRITLTPYQVGGHEIPAGAMLIACLGAANRDERVFGSDANVLRLDREQARQHVSFSLGTHHLPGLSARPARGSGGDQSSGQQISQTGVVRPGSLERPDEPAWRDGDPDQCVGMCPDWSQGAKIGRRVVFNIKGNDYRLIVAFAYRAERCYIKFIARMPSTTRLTPLPSTKRRSEQHGNLPRPH